ncbi:MAG: hypothetical protein ACFCGT_06895 [Sandaracinaceae bacterium]
MSDRRRLPVASAREGLGAPTIMDRALAARHGVAYVHLVVFAIDLDRVRGEVEGRAEWPFGWEVFLTQAYLLERLSPGADPAHRELLEDTVLSVLEGRPDALGGQLAFAVWDALARGCLPEALRPAFRGWRGQPGEDLAADLEALRARGEPLRRHLAGAVLEVPLDPPPAPPTRATLEAWASDL